jgi:hypothetical protein
MSILIYGKEMSTPSNSLQGEDYFDVVNSWGFPSKSSTFMSTAEIEERGGSFVLWFVTVDEKKAQLLASGVSMSVERLVNSIEGGAGLLERGFKLLCLLYLLENEEHPLRL